MKIPDKRIWIYLGMTLLFVVYLVFGKEGDNQILAEENLIDSVSYQRSIKGIVENKQITEASGLAVSIKHSAILYTHNDYGDLARLFAIDTTGRHVAILSLEGVANRDWEEIAPANVHGDAKLYIGDIGDNKQRYMRKHIYVVVEPDVLSGLMTVAVEQDIEFELEGGIRDTEAMFVDVNGDIYLCSKEDEISQLYKISYPYEKGVNVASLITTLNYHKLVGASLSVDAQRLLLKTKKAIWLWERLPDETIEDMLQRMPSPIPYTREPQGEAIAWDSKGDAFYTLSEEKHEVDAVLYFYSK